MRVLGGEGGLADAAHSVQCVHDHGVTTCLERTVKLGQEVIAPDERRAARGYVPRAGCGGWLGGGCEGDQCLV